ncbi:hypothetical protein M3J09_005789 [Ascochyta lentis]
MANSVQKEYPFDQDSYIAAFDDGQLAKQELKAGVPSWRSEGYAEDSSVEVLDHDHGVGKARRCNDSDLDQVLAEPPPQLRFILLLPTVHERIAQELSQRTVAADLFRMNEMYDDKTVDPADPEDSATWNGSRLNISRDALLKIMTRYDIAPGTCSHIRGQEQIFGSRTTKNDKNVVTAVEFWYAIRARAYFREVDKDADLKMTIITKYDVATESTVVLLKYRSFNDLPVKLKCELISKLKELVHQKSTENIAPSPFAVALMHFNCTAQWYRRAARDPRDSVRKEEEKSHELQKGSKNEINAINVRRLHLTMRNLDQDKLQLTQIIGTIKSLRSQHEAFYKYVKRVSAPEDRDWLYLRVDEELNRLDDQFNYQRSSIEDVCGRAQRLLDLLFNLSGQQNARWGEKVGKQAMHESANMRAVAIVSMLFLPGTFVSGILGTNLFSQEENKSGSDSDAGSTFRASSRWWLLLVTIIPLTALTFLGWSVWRSRTEAEIAFKITEEDKKTITLQNLERFNSRRKSSFATMGSSFANIKMPWTRQYRGGSDIELGNSYVT